MNRRSISIFVVVASILSFSDNVKGAEIQVPSGLRIKETSVTDAHEKGASEESTDDDDDTKDFSMTIGKGVKCKGRFNPRKKGVGKICEGGVKKMTHVAIGAQELAEDIASEVEDMQKNMIPDQKSLLPSDDIMMELIGLDDMEDIMTDGEDSLEDDFKKTVEFGGYFKLFWGCNVTFSKKGKKMSKDVVCGGKSVEGMGKKQDGGEMLATENIIGAIEF
mmetsp:Transcript_18850/g.41005  ORF Transcript_18850/g.41005 Transcript_18850/m.41005 type:complete len:220 (-) Transcript_18850:147-806(-)|eukprot:CAMPEP_0168179568 /NCGR_PEP_ID=MMETSP0139_2-20121125/9934_1 /TAXON_ID=44445 /ORGANISM="Pseudo-nitzschia australis, Strain 10249 10 AB" /LENGTH=219 /DNA_ID=CAMNT_0008099449 /DNA_START=152 /DNA_END=811 /DNA_ORIENTATION=+